MSRIMLATASAELEERVRKATNGEILSLPLGALPPDPAHVFAHLGKLAAPRVVVLDAVAEPEAALQLAARFDAECPAISVILVGQPTPELSLAAMRAGVRDFLQPAAEVGQIRELLDSAFSAAVERAAVLESARAQAVEDAAAASGKVITIVSPKGGVGKTTVATNVAVGLAKTAPRSTVLVDLDVQFGDVASALDLEPEYSLPDTVHGPASRDAMVLKTFLTKHQTGLFVICGPRTPADADGISGQDVSRLLQMLAAEFGYVVVDTSPGLSDHTLAALDQTTDLVLLTSMDVPGVRGLRKELDTLNQLDLVPASRQVVLNFTDTRAGLTIADVEATIGTRIDTRLPRSKAAQTSVNQGMPLLQSGARDPMSKALRSLVSQFAPASLSKLQPSRASRKAAKKTVKKAAPPPAVKPRRAAGPSYRGRWANAS
jgi:pilus assembly protein CpaE